MSKAILKKGLGLKVVGLAAVIAAVALVGVVFTQSADAVGPGDTADVTVTSVAEYTSGASDGVVRFTIDPNSSASGSFAYNGGQTLTCQDNSKCDTARAGDPPAHVDGTVTVKVNIDDDSPTGFIIVDVDDLRDTTTEDDSQLISVSVADRVVAISAVADAGAIAYNDSTGTVVRAHLTNNEGNGVDSPAGTTPVIVTTTLGVLNPCGTITTGVQACAVAAANGDHDGSTETAAVDGVVTVTLQGTSRAGVATVTFTLGDLTTSVDVVLYGEADSISADVQQSSIAIGGNTYIVVTALDSGGNPVVGHTVDVAASETSGADGVDGPAENSNEIRVHNDRDLDADGDRAVDMGDLPACGNQDATANDALGIAADTNLLQADGSTDVVQGTNASGQCVLRVDAPADLASTTVLDESATRGTHTVTIGGPADDGSKNISVAIQVGGAPASITSDAPASVDPLSSTKITVTVLDDEGVPVGAVATTVHKIEGAGTIIGGPGADAMTSDGQVSFTFLAPSTAGTAVFHVTAGTPNVDQITGTIVLTVGEPAAEAADAISLNLRAGGRIYAVTAEGPQTTAAALFGDAVNSAWKYNQDTGVWDVVYIPGRSGNFSIDTGDILFVTSPIDQTVGG